ncbi:MAG: cation:proton antiporter [Rhodanobacteraceae bacterium]
MLAPSSILPAKSGADRRPKDASQEIQFIRDLAIVMLAAGVVVVVLPRLRLPMLLGYIVAGVVIGPYTPWRFLTDERTMQSIANLGVVLLVFTLGLDFNLRKRRALGAGVMLAALVEAGLMLWMCVEIGRLAGLAPREALFLGGVICFSSTMIALRTAADRGWRGQGFVAGMVGMRVSEEVLTVVLITVLSAVAAGNANTTGVAFHVLWRMLLFVAVALVIGLLLDPSQLLPWLLPALGLALAVIVGKTLACSVGAFLCAGRSPRDALRTGLTMAQIG